MRIYWIAVPFLFLFVCLFFFISQVLPKDSKECSLITDYVKNTHAETHTQYELEVLEVKKLLLLFHVRYKYGIASTLINSSLNVWRKRLFWAKLLFVFIPL